MLIKHTEEESAGTNARFGYLSLLGSFLFEAPECKHAILMLSCAYHWWCISDLEHRAHMYVVR